LRGCLSDPVRRRSHYASGYLQSFDHVLLALDFLPCGKIVESLGGLLEAFGFRL